MVSMYGLTRAKARIMTAVTGKGGLGALPGLAGVLFDGAFRPAAGENRRRWG
jgi:hypothetical protein